MYNRYLHKDDVSQNYQEYNAEIDEEDPPRYYQKRDDFSEELSRLEKRNKPGEPDPAAEGTPHTTIQGVGGDGKYTTFNGDGTYKQYRGSGKSHGNIDRPNVKETSIHNSPEGPKIGKPTVRKPRFDEIPLN